MAGAEGRMEMELQPIVEPYRRMLLDVGEYLTMEYRQKLCTALGFSPVDMETRNNGLDLLTLMEERNIFNSQDVSKLEKILEEIAHKQAARVVRQYREPQENLRTQCVASVRDSKNPCQQQTDDIPTTPMTDVQKRALGLSMDVFEEELNVSFAINHLTEREIFKDSEVKSINEKPTQQEKVSEFVNVLKKKDANTFEVFQIYLKNSSKLAEELKYNLMLIQTKDKNSKERAEWLAYKEQTSYLLCSKESLHSHTDLPKVLNFMLIGKTGSGKSATGNTILKRKYFKEGHGSSSKTHFISTAECKENETVIRIVDTPGLFETGIRNMIIQRLQNRRLCFEIAKTALKFRKGIHLFILTYNPSSRFTPEEVETINYIENTLTKGVYDYCVLILTHSKVKFENISLREFIEEEKESGGKFAELLNNVHHRVIAVDNSFSETLKEENQRRLLLNSLAEVFSSNKKDKGDKKVAYQPPLFEVADNESTKVDIAREKKFDEEKRKLEMKTELDKYVYDLLFSFSLGKNDLKQLKGYLEKTFNDMLKATKVNKIRYFDSEEAMNHLKEFPDNNAEIIDKFVQLSDYIDNEKRRITTCLSDIKDKDNMTQEMKNCKKVFEVEEMLLNTMGKALTTFNQDDLSKLKYALQNGDDAVIGKMTKHMVKISTHHKSDEMNKIGQTFFNKNVNLILQAIDLITNTRALRDENDEKWYSEQKKNERLRCIYYEIDKRLKSFLSGRSVEQLRSVTDQIAKNVVPEDILRELVTHIYVHDKIQIDATEIEAEILSQLKEKIHIIEELIAKSEECFPEICTVSTRSNFKTSISMLKIGDEVLVYDEKGKLKYESVYLLSHANREVSAGYIKIITQKGKVLFISPSHYLPVGNLHNNIPAKEVVAGQSIFSVAEDVLTHDIITSLSYKVCKGAFCPMTMNGTIVVNEVAASCFTTFFNPSWGHALLCPIRLMFNYLPGSLFNTLLPYDSVDGMPLIFAKCHSAIICLRSFLTSLKKS